MKYLYDVSIKIKIHKAIDITLLHVYCTSTVLVILFIQVFTLRGITELLLTSNGLSGARKALLPSGMNLWSQHLLSQQMHAAPRELTLQCSSKTLC